MEEKLSQKKVILDHLKKFGSIEPLTALREYGCIVLVLVSLTCVMMGIISLQKL